MLDLAPCDPKNPQFARQTKRTLSLILLASTLGMNLACEESVIAIRVVVKVSEGSEIDQISVRSGILSEGTTSQFENLSGPDLVPEMPRLLAAEETLVLNFSADDSGREVAIEADALFDSQVVGFGDARVTIEAGAIAEIVLGELARCGDDVVQVLREECDDGTRSRAMDVPPAALRF